MNFRVGQKVVCVDDTPNGYPRCGVVRGKVYTVRAITARGNGIEVLEVEPIYALLGFHSYRFRPAVKPDISVFTAMLSKTPAENLSAARRTKRKEKAHV